MEQSINRSPLLLIFLWYRYDKFNGRRTVFPGNQRQSFMRGAQRILALLVFQSLLYVMIGLKKAITKS